MDALFLQTGRADASAERPVNRGVLSEDSMADLRQKG